MGSSLAEMLEEITMGSVAVTAASLLESVAADLTFAQWRALVVIDSAPGIRVGPLGARLGASQSATSRLVSRLERRGLLVSTPDPSDRRATLLRLTEAGQATYTQVRTARRRHLAELADEISTGSNFHMPTIAGLAAAFARRAVQP